MNWTKEKPTVEGLYWYFDVADPEIVKVHLDKSFDGGLSFFVSFFCYSVDEQLSNLDGEWYGPIEPPKY